MEVRFCPATARLPSVNGEAGQVGENWTRRKDGRMERLQGCDETVIDANEAVIIQPPTAGGYGPPASS